MSTQRTEALLSTIDEHVAAVAALKAERDQAVRQRNEAVGHFLLMSSQHDELRQAVQWLLDARSRTATEVNHAINHAVAILSKTKPTP